MAVILNIETSGHVCSVALTKDGMVEYQLDNDEGMNHAEVLAPFVEECMQEIDRKGEKLDAVAVSIGPGSYTGLRIGLSLAKGLAFSLSIPLIGVPTLKILAVKAMFRNLPWTGDEILLPMIDARRMEVYAAAYDFALNALIEPRPEVVTPESWAELLSSGRQVWLMGDGSEKLEGVITAPDAHFLKGMRPYAKDMTALSEKAFRERDFLDLAYSVPQYLKEYQATVGKNRVLEEARKESSSAAG